MAEFDLQTFGAYRDPGHEEPDNACALRRKQDSHEFEPNSLM
jgi:hypothetical protein